MAAQIHFKANDNEKNSIFQISLSNKSFLSHVLLELKHEQKQVFLTVLDVLRNRRPPGVLSEQNFSLIVMVKEL